MKVIVESLKTLMAEAANHQSQIDSLLSELSTIKQDYEGLQKTVSELNVDNTEECLAQSEYKEGNEDFGMMEDRKINSQMMDVPDIEEHKK